MKYPNLFSPLSVGNLELRNRIVLAPMSFTRQAPGGGFSDELLAYTEAIAKGGTALITIGESIIGNGKGKTHPDMIFIGDPSVQDGLVRIAEAVHRHGALISIELSHGGFLADPALNNGELPIGPNPVPDWLSGKDGATLMMSGEAKTFRAADKQGQVKVMDEVDMSEIADTFAQSVKILKDSGFDMVQIHMGHGWLLHQFISPTFNNRTDEYGGSPENRLRFPIMVLKRIREVVGERFPLDARISGTEVVPGGYDENYAAQVAKNLSPYLDMISVSCGGIYHPMATERMSPHIFKPRGVNVYLAEAVRKAVDIPVAAVGALGEPEMLEEIISDGRADLTTMGRALIADHDFPNKARKGETEEIFHCLRCNACQNALFNEPGHRIHCAVNPIVGLEADYAPIPPKAPVSRKVLVAGGGPAGLEAALIAAYRGHSVTLCEATDRLGGALRFADVTDFKWDIKVTRDRLIAKVENHPNIYVQLSTPVDEKTINSLNPDAVICAVGAYALVPPIPGTELDHVLTGKVYYEQMPNLGNRIVVIGGGLVGCETAVFLAGLGHSVTVLEMRDDVAIDSTGAHRVALMGQIVERDVKVIVGGQCKQIDRDAVYADVDGETLRLKADNVIMAAGMASERKQVRLMSAVSPSFHVIGDCKKPGKILEAIRDGYFAAMDIE